MQKVKQLIFLTAFSLFISTTANGQYKSLFDGKNLSGWHADILAKDKDSKIPNAFVVRDGMLVSLGEPRGHLITDAVYQNYR